MGSNIGSLVGPPVGGALYQRWGFRAPFTFGILVTGIDIFTRLLLIERHEAMRSGVDPMADAVSNKERDPEVSSGATALERAKKLPAVEPQPCAPVHNDGSSVYGGEGLTNIEIREEAKRRDQREKRLHESKKSRVTSLPHIVLLELMRSSRATVSILLTLVWASVRSAQETVVVLYMNRIWGLDPHQAGIAFIVAVVPAIFCESRIFLIALVTYSNCVSCSWDSFRLVGR